MWRYTSTLSLTLELDRGWVVNTMPWSLYPWERDLVPITQEAGWAPQPPRADVDNLATTWIQSPHQLTHGELLYRPSYPGPL